MNSAWTRHLKDDKDISNFEKQLKNSRTVLDRLSVLLQEQIDQWESVETSVASYDTPNWDYKQAHRNGQRSAIKSVLKLLDHKEH